MILTPLNWLRVAFCIKILLTYGTTIAQTSRVTQAINELMETSYTPDLPGATVLVAVDDKIVFKKGYGKASLKTGEAITPNHVFRIGSITKQFTSVAILKLVAEGKIKLDDPVIKFVPHYPQTKNVTVRHLLTHTSGIKSYTAVLELKTPENKMAEKTTQERFNDFKDLPLEFQPGEKYRYSNSGYFLLGMIIEKVSGMTYGDYLKKEVFTPLKMQSSFYDGGSKFISAKATGYVQREHGFIEAGFVHHSMPYSAGALASTAEDLFKWSLAVFSFKVLPESLIEEAWKPARLRSGKEINYGFGWSLGRLDDLKVIYHGGAIDGYVCYSLNIPSKKLFIAILTNKEDYGVIGQSDRIARIVLDKPVQNPTPVALRAPELNEYIGVYQTEDNLHRVIMRKNDTLFSKDVFGDTVEMLAYKKDGFFLKDRPVKLDFERDGNNAIAAINVTGSDWLIGKETKTDSSQVAQKKPIKLENLVFDQYTGEYEIAKGFSIKVWRDSDRYMVASSTHGTFEMFAESDSKFFIPGVGVDIEFVKEHERVSGLILTMNGASNKGPKIH